MLAGIFAGAPVRIHTFSCQVWGVVMEWILKNADQITTKAATHILIGSYTQRQNLFE